MNVTQSNVSHFERNPNIFLRSLAGYVEALGGRLEVRAVFLDQVVTLAVSGPQRQQPDAPQREQAPRNGSRGTLLPQAKSPLGWATA